MLYKCAYLYDLSPNFLFRLAYFMQMHSRLGPISIHFSKTMSDVATMVIIFTVALFGFSFSLVFLLSSDVVVSRCGFHNTK